MAITELKIKLGALIRAHLKQSKLRQLDFAHALNVSASAVSQMLSGRMVPSLPQLDVIAQKLALDRNQTAELRDCLARIRTGEATIRSPLNDFLKSARIRRGLSIGQLSKLTGIPASDITTLETRVGVQPSPTEAVRLAAVLECEIGELWQSLPPVPVYGGAVELREPSAYRAEPVNKVPVVGFGSLPAFDPAYDTPQEFAWRHLLEVRSVADGGLLLVRADGRELGWPERYELELMIAPDLSPDKGTAVLAAAARGVVIGEMNADGSAVRLLNGETVTGWRWCWVVEGLTMRLGGAAVRSGDAAPARHECGAEYGIRNE